MELTSTLAHDYPLDTGIRSDLAGSLFQVGHVLLNLNESARTPVPLIEAKDNLDQAAGILRSLKLRGQMNPRGNVVVDELDDALEKLANAQADAAKPPKK